MCTFDMIMYVYIVTYVATNIIYELILVNDNYIHVYVMLQFATV